MSDDEKKIFVDEDWKAQVQRERDEAARKMAEEPAVPQTQADESPIPGGEDIGEEGVPEASFMTLVGSLATQAMFALGVIAQPGQKDVMVDLMHAKYCIDLLTILREKTEGNLSEDETVELTQALAELQHVFVARAQQIQEAELKNAGVDLSNIRGDKA